MRRALLIAKTLGLFVLYVWICWEFYLFNVMDTCSDGGGTYDAATHACTYTGLGQNWDVGARASFFFWVALLGLPAALVLAANKALSYVASKLWKTLLKLIQQKGLR